MQENKGRIEWVDIFKALVIISVVIGHATGRYNMFIYQFHMGAFFFISGFTSSLKKRDLFETIYNKFCTILLPFFSIFFIGLLFLGLLNKFGLYHYLFKDPFIGMWNAIKQLFLFGNNFVFWMGASWFLLVLFYTVILQKLIFTLSGSCVNYKYILSSIILLLLGYYFIDNHIIGQFGLLILDLTLIGQFYFFLGVYSQDKKIFKIYLSKNWIFTIGILFNLAIMYYFGILHPTTVDYPSRRFGFFATDVLAVINGILLIYFISQLLIYMPTKIKKNIIHIGENTIGILFFHFMFFIVVYGILILCKVVPLSYMQNFTPTDQIGRKYWSLFVVISILCSLVLWKLMTLSKLLRILLGKEKELYEFIYKRICEWPFCKKFSKYKVETAFFKRTFFILKQEIKNNKYTSIIILNIVILVLAPMASQGIIVNDELQARFRRIKGFISSIKEGFAIEIFQGRPMRLFAAIQNALSFVSSNIYIYKAIQISTLLLAIIIFGYFLHKLFDSKKFSIFTCISILVFLPITFEHAVPNAFICLTTFPLMFLLISFLLFIFYIQNKKTLCLVSSMILLFIALLGYEFMVTFILFYPIIYFLKVPKEQYSFKNLFIYNIYPIAVGILYILLMFGSNTFVSKNYSGAQLEFISIRSSFNILSTLFMSSLPGYYLFNAKYNYLFNYYNPESFPINIITLKGVGLIGDIERFTILGKAIGKYVLENMINMRILLLSLMFFLFLLFILPRRNNVQEKTPFSWFAILIGFAYMIIPATPISVSKLYQGNVTADKFTSLPVSIFLYFSAIFTFCYIIWMILEKKPWKYSVTITAIVICLYSIPIQAMNSTFSQVQYENYNRLIAIEHIFDTATIKNLNYQTVYAPELYETRNALAVHETYWTQYSQFKGLNLEIQKDKKPQYEAIQIFYQEDKFFIIYGGNEVVVLSPSILCGIKPLKTSNTEFVIANFNNEVVDGNFYRYSFTRTPGSNNLIAKNNTDTPFASLRKDVGTTLKTANILYGYSADGWLGKSAELKIHTGKEGKLIISAFFPNEITGKEIGTIFIDDKAYPFKITESSFSFELPAKKESVITVRIENNFVFQAVPPDIRQLSFILVDVQGR